MHLLFLSQTFPDADDPTRGAYNFALCRAAAIRNQVTVVAPRSWPKVLRHRVRGRSFTALETTCGAPIDCRYPTFWYTSGVRHAHHGAAMWRSVRSAVEEIHETSPIDAVLSYWAHPDGEAGLCAARFVSVPHVVIVGGSDVLLLPERGPRRDVVGRVLRESDAVMTVSEGLRQATISLGVDADHVHTIYQGTDRQRFHPGDRQQARRRLGLPADRTLLFWVGRVVEVKRLDLLVAACGELQRTGMNFELCLAGDGPLRGVTQRLVEQAGLSERVRFVGPVRHAELPEWYRAADVTVLSSRSEGLPNVLRESLSCGTPFAATDVGSIKEIADLKWSRLAPAGDCRLLARAIREVVESDCRGAAVNYRARSWAECAMDVEALIDRLRPARLATGSREVQPASAAPGSVNSERPRHDSKVAAECELVEQ